LARPPAARYLTGRSSSSYSRFLAFVAQIPGRGREGAVAK